MSSAKCIMVQGTMSGAGKSVLCAALCRIFAQDGYKTAPFKSQNMALNSFVTRDGLEMGRAQVVQAQAAGVEPDVRMNPILLKPSSDIGSQVIVNGEVRGNMPAKEYFRHKRALIPDILQAYNSLAEEFDIIVIEGAGSPAEINLKADDIVNMGLAKLVDAPVLLAGDIDRGGVFAQLYGTVELLEPEEREVLQQRDILLSDAAFDPLDNELQNIYACLAQPSEHLTVSYPVTDHNGGQLRPSFVVRRLERLFPGLMPERETVRLLTPAVALEEAGQEMGGSLDRKSVV